MDALEPQSPQYSARVVPPTDDARNAMNVLLTGCPVRVHAEYLKRTVNREPTLTLKPSDEVD